MMGMKAAQEESRRHGNIEHDPTNKDQSSREITLDIRKPAEDSRAHGRAQPQHRHDEAEVVCIQVWI